MSDHLSKLLVPRSADRRSVADGVVVGIVTNNKDPDGLNRVRVRFPGLTEAKDETFWARMVTPMAGNGRGLYFLPEPEDEVLCVFAHGNMREPYVIGALWNGDDKPPFTNADGDNNIRAIVSRSGHVIVFNDKDGEETLEITDASGDNSIVIDTAANSITVTAGKNITIAAPDGTVTISGQTVKIEASNDGAFTTGGPVDRRTGAAPPGSLKISADGALKVKGTTVDIN